MSVIVSDHRERSNLPRKRSRLKAERANPPIPPFAKGGTGGIRTLLVFFVAAFMLLVSSVGHAEGGKLKKLEDMLGNSKQEQTVQKDSKPSQTVKKQVDEDSKPAEKKFGMASSTGESLESSIVQTLLGIFLAGAFEMAQEEDLNYVYKYLKKNESPALPTFRLEGGYQYLAGEDQSASARLEVGYLMIGAEGEYRRYWERSPDDKLNVASGHVLLRALFSDVFQINLALGEKVLWGDVRHDGFEVGFPFYVIFGKHITWDVRPYLAFVGGHDVYDVSTGISYKYKMIGARGGYRAMNVEDLTLHGPEIGMFLQW